MPACPNCKSADLVKIDLGAVEGPLRFSSCRECEHRWWMRRDEQSPVALEEVLDAVGGARR